MPKCDSCGKFRKQDELIGCGNEFGNWTECAHCTDDNERQRAKKLCYVPGLQYPVEEIDDKSDKGIDKDQGIW